MPSLFNDQSEEARDALRFLALRADHGDKQSKARLKRAEKELGYGNFERVIAICQGKA